MNKYKTGARYPKPEISVVEAIRETDQCVWVKGYGQKLERRESKRSEWTIYHDTWEAAHAFLLAKAEMEIERSKNAVERALANLATIRSMTKDEAQESKP